MKRVKGAAAMANNDELEQARHDLNRLAALHGNDFLHKDVLEASRRLDRLIMQAQTQKNTFKSRI